MNNLSMNIRRGSEKKNGGGRTLAIGKEVKISLADAIRVFSSCCG